MIYKKIVEKAEFLVALQEPVGVFKSTEPEELTLINKSPLKSEEWK